MIADLIPLLVTMLTVDPTLRNHHLCPHHYLGSASRRSGRAAPFGCPCELLPVAAIHFMVKASCSMPGLNAMRGTRVDDHSWEDFRKVTRQNCPSYRFKLQVLVNMEMARWETHGTMSPGGATVSAPASTITGCGEFTS